jgi:hypothetical protein
MSNRYTSIIDGFTKQLPRQAPQPTYTAPAPRPSVNKRQKIVEMIVEKPVIVQRYVDVPEDVIIEKPVERLIEQPIYTERYIDVPREEIVERDVEVVREEIREFITERRVEVEKYVDIPVNVVREVPVEHIREVDVKVPVYKDKWIDRTKIKPIETIVQEILRYVDKPIIKDGGVVERFVEVPVDRVVERFQERRVEVPVIREVEKIIHVDKVVEIPVERFYDVVVDKIITREIQVPVTVDKYVDRPYDVPVEKVVQVPREILKENRVTVTVDKIVEVPVERIVEVPVRNEKRLDNVYAVTAETPVFNPIALDVPVPRVVDKPVQANAVVEVPSERVVERRVDVPYGRVVERPVVKDLQVEVHRIVETTKNVDRNIDIPVHIDKFVERFSDEVVEKPITLQKIIERPVVVPKYVDRYVDKHVDVKIEIPIPKIVEVPRVTNTDKVVDANVRVQKARYSQRAHTVPINTVIRGQVLSQAQKRRFHESSQLLANAIVENEKIKAEMTYLREKINIRGNITTGLGSNVNQAEVDRLRRVIIDLETSLRTKESERNRLRQTSSTTAEIDVQTRNDASDVPKLQDHIRRVKAENESLRRLANKGKFESTRNFVGQRVSSALGGTATGIQNFANAFRNTAPASGTLLNHSSSAGVLPQRLSSGYTTTNVVPATTTYNTNGIAGLLGGYATRPSTTYASTVGVPATTTYGGTTTNYGTAGIAGLLGNYNNRPSGGYTTTTGVPVATTNYGGTNGIAGLLGNYPTTTTTTGVPVATTNYGATTTSYGTNGIAGLLGNYTNRPSGGYSTTTTGVPVASTTGTYSKTGAPIITRPSQPSGGQTLTGQW